jgi:hypothetical protein
VARRKIPAAAAHHDDAHGFVFLGQRERRIDLVEHAIALRVSDIPAG